MQCPHCGDVTPSVKWEDWNRKARPLPGSYFLCCKCGGFGVFETYAIVRKMYRGEYDAIRNLPEIIKLEDWRKQIVELARRRKPRSKRRK